MAKAVQVGAVFGAWTVLQKAETQQRYLCQCACGTERKIRVYDLIKGKTLMCKRCSHTVPRKHGAYTDPSMALTHSSWLAMMQRCYNPNNKSYEDYGGRGILVFDLWKESFESFYLMVGARPGADYTLERLDFNQGYVPGNVTWATRADQTRNKSDNVKFTFEGVTQTISEWATDDRCPVSKYTVYKRLKRGWDPQRALFTASRNDGKDQLKK
jgi:hypothetical protein